MNESAVVLENVFKSFQGTNAVDDVNLEIFEGEFFSLLGPSGCGKSSTLRMIAGLESPTQGNIYIRGQKANDLPPYMRNVNLVFQNYALFPHLNVEQNVAFGLEMKGGLSKSEIGIRVGEALELVRLSGYGKRKPKELSGGQQQRVALARALVNRPAVVLLDEPLAALDLKLRQQMQIELKQIQKKVGMTFIYVTHDQEEALSLSDRLAIMHKGKVVQVGSPSDVYEEPENDFVATFLGESNLIEARVVSVAGARLALTLKDGVTFEIPHAEKEIFKRGSSVFLSIRPERIQMVPFAHSSEKSLKAVVGDLVYLGKERRYRVVANDSLSLLVSAPPDTSISVGDQVGLSWNDSNMRILRCRDQ